MAHYRSLNEVYEYNVGKQFVELRKKDKTEKKIVAKVEIGHPISKGRVIVQPGDILHWLERGHRRPIEKSFYTCKCKNVEKHLGVLPFDMEIYGKKVWVYMCEECYDRNADDI